MIPQVVASERGTAQTAGLCVLWGSRTYIKLIIPSGSCLENNAEEGESPVYVRIIRWWVS